MKRSLVILLFTVSLLALRPAPAAADLTGFIGFSPTPDTRSAKGVAIGVSLIVVGFEFEYSHIVEDQAKGTQGLTTGMGNLMVMTPTYKLQLYGTTGGGLFHESYRSTGTTSFGTNIGGGAKLALAGPIRLRLDYRVFNLNGNPLYKRVQRFYGGISVAF